MLNFNHMFFCKVYESDEDETFYDARSRPESPCVWGLKGGGGGQNKQQGQVVESDDDSNFSTTEDPPELLVLDLKDPDFNGASDLSPAR